MSEVGTSSAFIKRSLQYHQELTQEEEQRLALASLAGDRQARHTLVCSLLKLVYGMSQRIARRVGRPDMVEDFYQTGCQVLAEKVPEFDPARGTRLSTFVYLPIVKAIFRELKLSSREAPTDRLPEFTQEDEERFVALRAVLGKILSPKQLEVVRYRIELGMTYEKIAETYGGSERTWKRYWSETLDVVRACCNYLREFKLLKGLG